MKKLILLPLLAIVFACGTKENEKAIKGLKPVDVYMNLEKEGFKTAKSLGGELKTWTNIKSDVGGVFTVETSSSDSQSVEFVRATVQTDATGDINKSLSFFKYIASLPYESSNYELSTKWLDKNFNEAESDTIVNGVKFTLRSPSKMVKTLQLEKQ